MLTSIPAYSTQPHKAIQGNPETRDSCSMVAIHGLMELLCSLVKEKEPQRVL